MSELQSSRRYYSDAHHMRVVSTERILTALAREGVEGLKYERHDDEEVTTETWRSCPMGPIVARLTTTWLPSGYVLNYERFSN